MSETNSDASWDAYVRGLISEHWEIAHEAIGNAIGLAVKALRDELLKEMRTSLRIAILEQAGMLPKVCGTWDPTRTYDALSIVAKDGGTFVAKRSGPGECPGEDWQLMSIGSRGKIGPRGERGEKGESGADGRSIGVVGWLVDPTTFMVTPRMADGSYVPAINLRPLFEAYNEQVFGVPAKQTAAPRAEPPMLIEMVTRDGE
jgi:hypothetical protein